MPPVAHFALARHWRLSLALALAGLVFTMLGALGAGASDVGPAKVAAWLWPFGSREADPNVRLIIEQLRLLAALIGALLAAGGAVMQGLFRNPLADPSLIGVSAGASAGAGLVIVFSAGFSQSLLGLSLVSLGAFGGAVLTVWLIYRLSSGPEGTSVVTMLLAGIAVSFLAGSLTGLLEYMADSQMLRRMSLWRMGGFDTANYQKLLLVLAVVLLTALTLPRYFRGLDALLLGESEARHLGLDVDHLKKAIIILVALGVGVSVAMAGTIAFLGLMVPHFVRMLLGPAHHLLVPFSALAGAILLVLADALARTLIAPSELPVGLLTALIGAPVFISLLRKRHSLALG
jgi:iron complex transport system permease protein